MQIKIEPIFYINQNHEKIIKKIEKNLDLIEINDKDKKRNLQTKARVRSIHSSLAIEENSLNLKAIENIIDNKIVLGDKKEIQEVKNANELYENIDKYNWKDENDFINAHNLLMKYFNDDNKHYRNHGEAVKKGSLIIYSAPESIFVPSLMKSLFEFLNQNDSCIHPLILASVFHYYFVTIHPFSDGNGRLARFWVSLILTSWNEKFKYIPIEEEIYLNQKDYYDSISKCHNNGNANVFIDFMLNCINSLLEKTTQKTTQRLNDNQRKIIYFIKKNPHVTRKELAIKLNITTDGVKYNLKKLIDNNIIERIGPDNGGYWSIK